MKIDMNMRIFQAWWGKNMTETWQRLLSRLVWTKVRQQGQNGHGSTGGQQLDCCIMLK